MIYCANVLRSLRKRKVQPDEFFIESFSQMCFEGKWLQNRLRADKNKSSLWNGDETFHTDITDNKHINGIS